MYKNNGCVKSSIGTLKKLAASSCIAGHSRYMLLLDVHWKGKQSDRAIFWVESDMKGRIVGIGEE